jgi:hypothetical protein
VPIVCITAIGQSSSKLIGDKALSDSQNTSSSNGFSLGRFGAAVLVLFGLHYALITYTLNSASSCKRDPAVCQCIKPKLVWSLKFETYLLFGGQNPITPIAFQCKGY